MKWAIILLLLAIFVLQAKLWLGSGGLLEVKELQHSVDELAQQNTILRERNASLDAEVKDLKQGLKAIEERSRSDLGMIKKNETFFQIIDNE